MKTRILMFIAVLVALSTAPLYAQTSATIKKGEAYSLVADYDAPADPQTVIAEFRVYANGKLLTIQTPAQAGCASFPCSPQFGYTGNELGRGSYTMYMEAVDDQGQASGPSNAVTLVVTTGPPHPPKNLRIVKGSSP